MAPPAPARGHTRQTAAALPATQRAGYLLEGARLFAADAPELAAALGRAALAAAEGQHGALPRGAAATLCARCGAPHAAAAWRAARAAELPRQAARRSKRRAAAQRLAAAKAVRHSGEAAAPQRAALVLPCAMCAHAAVRKCASLRAAEEMLGKGRAAAGVAAEPQ